MPSTYTVSHRFELQGTGENLNSWGQRLNAALSRVDKAVGGVVAIVLAGVTYTLSVSNVLDDEARSAALDLSGVGGCTIILPSVSKLYWMRNGSNGNVTISTGAGATVVMSVNDITRIWCDGISVYTQSFGGTGIKAYVDATAFGSMSGTFPGQAGNAGKVLTTNGVTPAWTAPTAVALTDYNTAVKGLALAFAIAL